jgi:hypothetical protein
MKINTKLLVIVLAVTTLTLGPTIIVINPADAESHYCSDEKGKSKAWIEGCKQGWYDHDHCLSYNPGTGEVAQGYKVGWSKGSCK